MKSIDVLLPAPMMPLIMQGVEASFTAHRLWEARDRAAAIAGLAPKIRAMAAGASHQPVDAAFLSLFPNLEIVASFGVGYDHVDAKWAGAHGVTVTNTPDVLNEEVADTAMGLLLATVRQLPQAANYLREGKWLERPFALTATLRGRRLGILGLGRIGKAIARRAETFGLKIAYHGRHRQSDVAYPYYATLTSLAQDVDILLAIAPGGPETRNIINAEVLQALGPQGIFINVARGSLVDEAALIEALRAGTIMTAGLDVFADEPQVPQALLDMPHIVLLPHVGSASQHCRDAMGQLVVDNLRSWATGAGPLTPVAETPWRRAAKPPL